MARQPARLAYRQRCRACVRLATIIVASSGGRIVPAPGDPREPVLELQLGPVVLPLRRWGLVAGVVASAGPVRAVRIARAARRAGVLALPPPRRA